jgi:hypothetical protein
VKRPRRLRRRPLYLLALCLVAAHALAESTREFTQEGRHYAFTASFDVDAPPDRLLDLLYGFEHLQRYSRRSRSELLEQGPNWQRVRYTHGTWLWALEATMRRELDRDAGCVRFEMESAGRSGLPVPLPTASSGYFCVAPGESGQRITYRQVGEAGTSMLTDTWMRYARKEAVAFADDLENYIRLHAR